MRSVTRIAIALAATAAACAAALAAWPYALWWAWRRYVHTLGGVDTKGRPLRPVRGPGGGTKYVGRRHLTWWAPWCVIRPWQPRTLRGCDEYGNQSAAIVLPFLGCFTFFYGQRLDIEPPDRDG